MDVWSVVLATGLLTSRTVSCVKPTMTLLNHLMVYNHCQHVCVFLLHRLAAVFTQFLWWTTLLFHSSAFSVFPFPFSSSPCTPGLLLGLFHRVFCSNTFLTIPPPVLSVSHDDTISVLDIHIHIFSKFLMNTYGNRTTVYLTLCGRYRSFVV